MPPEIRPAVFGDGNLIDVARRESTQAKRKPAHSNPYTGQTPNAEHPPLMDPGTVAGVSVAAVAGAVVVFFILGTVINICWVRRQAKRRKLLRGNLSHGRWHDQGQKRTLGAESQLSSQYGRRAHQTGAKLYPQMQENETESRSNPATVGLAITQYSKSAKATSGDEAPSSSAWKPLPSDPPLSTKTAQEPFQPKPSRPASNWTLFEEDAEPLLRSRQSMTEPEEPPPAYAPPPKPSSLRPRQSKPGITPLPKIIPPPTIQILSPVEETPPATSNLPTDSSASPPRPPMSRHYASPSNRSGPTANTASPMDSPARVISYIPGYYTSLAPPSPFSPEQNGLSSSRGVHTNTSGGHTGSRLAATPDYFSQKARRASSDLDEPLPASTDTSISSNSTVTPASTPPQEQTSSTRPTENQASSPPQDPAYPSAATSSNPNTPKPHQPPFANQPRKASPLGTNATLAEKRRGQGATELSVDTSGQPWRKNQRHHHRPSHQQSLAQTQQPQQPWQSKWMPRMSGDDMIIEVC